MDSKAVAATEEDMSSWSEEEKQARAQQIAQTYKIMRAKISQLATKIGELDTEKSEHALVVKTISTLDAKRRCYRSIGGVLVERTVGEVLPAVQGNLQKIEGVINSLTEEVRTREKECEAFRAKYNISIGKPGQGVPEQA